VDVKVIWVRGEGEYFCGRGWTRPPNQRSGPFNEIAAALYFFNMLPIKAANIISVAAPSFTMPSTPGLTSVAKMNSRITLHH
jgi:hypothetical protein